MFFNLSLEINPNATLNVVDQDGNVLVDSATSDECREFVDQLIAELEQFKAAI